MRVTSLGFRTDVALRVLEGAEVADRDDHLIVCSPGNPDYWWGNFLLLAGWPAPGTGELWLARFAAEFPLAHHIALGVETDPRARRQGLAGTLVWHAGRYGREVLGAGTFVIVADPADVAIRIYRACGFAGTQSQFSFERPSLSASSP